MERVKFRGKFVTQNNSDLLWLDLFICVHLCLIHLYQKHFPRIGTHFSRASPPCLRASVVNLLFPLASRKG